MNKFLIIFLEMLVSALVYIIFKTFSDTFISGWVAGAICLAIFMFIDKQ